MGRTQEAMKQFQLAEQLNPLDANTYFYLALANSQLNHSAAAQAAAQKAAELARSQGQTALAQKIAAWLLNYQGGPRPERKDR